MDDLRLELVFKQKVSSLLLLSWGRSKGEGRGETGSERKGGWGEGEKGIRKRRRWVRLKKEKRKVGGGRCGEGGVKLRKI